MQLWILLVFTGIACHFESCYNEFTKPRKDKVEEIEGDWMESTEALILIIDDNQSLLDVVAMALENEGYRILAAGDGQTGLEMFWQHNPDLVILDIMMPGMDGWQVCNKLKSTSGVPLILLTVLEQEKDIIRGLEEGADDYVSKPFSVRELLGRVQALLRRAQMLEEKLEKKNSITHNFRLVPNNQQVIVDGRVIRLTSTEFSLLYALIDNAGQVISYHDLLCKVWGQEYKANVRQLKVYIYYLRQKLENDPRNPCYIINERGRGYRLVF